MFTTLAHLRSFRNWKINFPLHDDALRAVMRKLGLPNNYNPEEVLISLMISINIVTSILL